MKEQYKIYNGDCLEIMKEIPDKSLDMILCDLPYSQTKNQWDTIIPFDRLWEQYNRIIKDNGAIVLFANGMFTADLMKSNQKNWKYNLVWNKVLTSGFLNANRMPLRQHEDICVFYKKQPTYNPQYWYSTPYETKERKRKNEIEGLRGGSAANICTATVSEDGKRYPLSIIKMSRDGNRIHPTQKPIALLEYLIRTYTKEGETVLDFTMGSGSTGVACVNTNRRFIGIELDECYFNIAKERIEKAIKEA